jgi:2-aminoadipate transaminase
MTDYDAFLSTTGRDLQESAIRRMGTVVARQTDLVSFAPGYPDPALFPWDELREIADGLLAGRAASSLQYGPTRGHGPLLTSIVGILEGRGIDVAREQILITSGSQQGMDLAARVLIDPGDVVLVELPTFTGAIAAFKNAHARLAGVPLGPDGLDPDEVDAAWRRETEAGRRVKLLYLIPNFQNPTGALMTLERRARILEWAERRDVLIVEDDPYGALYFEDVASEAETRPLRADDRHGRVLYLSTFSKTLAPGFRVGWMVAPAELVDRFETAKQSTDLMSGSFDQAIVDEAVRRGVIDRLAPQLRATYQEKRTAMEQALRAELGGRVTWRTPKGGFFVWLTLPEGTTDLELFDRAMEHGLVFVIGSAFHVDGSGHDTIRLSFSAPSIPRIQEGVRRLAAVMHPLATR